MTDQTRQGFVYGLTAYGLWGVIPIYLRWLRDDVGPAEMLAHRIAWTALFLAVILTATRRWRAVGRVLADRRRLGPLALSALLIGVNWLVYIVSVHQDKITHASLGYYVTPLVSVMLGLAVFHEHLRRLQWVALALAAVGVGLLTWLLGEVPWIALALAATFSTYGLVRKQVPVDGLVGLSVETLLLLPVALAYLAIWGDAGLAGDGLTGRLALSGVVTAIPLLCFGQAARMLPLSTLGFLQYSSPTIQLLVAVLLFKEPLAPVQLASFAVIWAALGLFTVDSVRWYRQRGRDAAGEPEPDAADYVPPLPTGGRVRECSE